MTEQQKRVAIVSTHVMPRIVVRANWVAVRYETFGPWYVSQRSTPGAEPVECYALPDHDALFGL